MTLILGLSPTYVIGGAAALGLFLVLFIALLTGPSTVMDGAFGLLAQTMASASTTLGTLLVSSGPVIAQGMELTSTIINQGSMIIANGIEGAAAAANTVFSIVASAITSAAQIVASLAATGAQIVASAAAMGAQIVVSGVASITSIYFTIQNAVLEMGVVLVQDAVMALGSFMAFIATTAAQIVASIGTTIAAILGQLIQIGLSIFTCYLNIRLSIISLQIHLQIAAAQVSLKLLTLITKVFTTDLLVKGFEKIGTAIGDGFTDFFDELPEILKKAFFGD